jgi:predicted enzyme related to lactoylglutathione lyase
MGKYSMLPRGSFDRNGARFRGIAILLIRRFMARFSRRSFTSATIFPGLKRTVENQGCLHGRFRCSFFASIEIEPFMTARVSRIILFVRDVPGVAAFYQRHFGLEPIETSEEGWRELSAGGCNLALHRATTTSRERGRSPAKIVFAMSDVHAAKQRFAAEGLKFGKVYEVNGFAFANARDPEGNPIQISSRGLS